MRREPPGGPVKKLVEEIFPDIHKTHALVQISRPNAYNLSWEEVVTVSQLIRMLTPRTVFEFGTFDGRTTLFLALNATDDAIVYTIDVEEGTFDFGADTPYFKEVKIGECFLGSPVKQKIRMLTGNSRHFDFTPFMKSIDFILIDACHSYEGVLSDSEKAFQMVRPGGLVVWHDYLVLGEVTRAMLALCKTKELKNLKGTSLVLWQAPSQTHSATPQSGRLRGC